MKKIFTKLALLSLLSKSNATASGEGLFQQEGDADHEGQLSSSKNRMNLFDDVEVKKLFGSLKGDHAIASSLRSTVAKTIRDLAAGDGAIPCNKMINVASIDDIKIELTSKFNYIKNVMQPRLDGTMETLLNVLIPKMEYDVGLFKVCAKCSDFEDLNGYGCEADDYGSDVTHSGLMGLPVAKDINGDYTIINTKKLQAWFQFPVISVAPVDLYAQVYGDFAYGKEFAIIAAALGMVSFVPEKTGYGESSDLVISGLVKKSLTTSTLPLFAKAKTFVDMMSDGKTKLTNKAYFAGYSEGGYSALAAAEGFDRNGIEVLKVFSGGAPIKLGSSQIVGLYRVLASSKDPALLFRIILFSVYALLPYAVRDDLDDGGQGVNEAFLSDFTSLFHDDNAPSAYDANSMYPNYLFGTYPALYEAISTNKCIDEKTALFFGTAALMGVEDPCKSDNLELAGGNGLCAIILANDLEESVKNATYDITLCHSTDDELVFFSNAVESRLDLTVNGLHGISGVTCTYGLFAAFVKSYEKPEANKSPKSMKGTKASKSTKGTESSTTAKATKSKSWALRG